MYAHAVLTCVPPSLPFTERVLALNQPVAVLRASSKVFPHAQNATFESRSMTRRHAILSYEGEHFYVEDLKSSNGTFINGKRIAGDTPKAKILPGDVIQFGATVTVIQGCTTETHLCTIASLTLYRPGVWRNIARSLPPSPNRRNLLALKPKVKQPLALSIGLHNSFNLHMEGVHRSPAELNKVLQAMADVSYLGTQVLHDQLHQTFISQITQLREDLQTYVNNTNFYSPYNQYSVTIGTSQQELGASHRSPARKRIKSSVVSKRATEAIPSVNLDWESQPISLDKSEASEAECTIKALCDLVRKGMSEEKNHCKDRLSTIDIRVSQVGRLVLTLNEHFKRNLAEQERIVEIANFETKRVKTNEELQELNGKVQEGKQCREQLREGKGALERMVEKRVTLAKRNELVNSLSEAIEQSLTQIEEELTKAENSMTLGVAEQQLRNKKAAHIRGKEAMWSWAMGIMKAGAGELNRGRTVQQDVNVEKLDGTENNKIGRDLKNERIKLARNFDSHNDGMNATEQDIKAIGVGEKADEEKVIEVDENLEKERVAKFTTKSKKELHLRGANLWQDNLKHRMSNQRSIELNNQCLLSNLRLTVSSGDVDESEMRNNDSAGINPDSRLRGGRNRMEKNSGYRPPELCKASINLTVALVNNDVEKNTNGISHKMPVLNTEGVAETFMDFIKEEADKVASLFLNEMPLEHRVEKVANKAGEAKNIYENLISGLPAVYLNGLPAITCIEKETKVQVNAELSDTAITDEDIRIRKYDPNDTLDECIRFNTTCLNPNVMFNNISFLEGVEVLYVNEAMFRNKGQRPHEKNILLPKDADHEVEMILDDLLLIKDVVPNGIDTTQTNITEMHQTDQNLQDTTIQNEIFEEKKHKTLQKEEAEVSIPLHTQRLESDLKEETQLKCELFYETPLPIEEVSVKGVQDITTHLNIEAELPSGTDGNHLDSSGQQTAEGDANTINTFKEENLVAEIVESTTEVTQEVGEAHDCSGKDSNALHETEQNVEIGETTKQVQAGQPLERDENLKENLKNLEQKVEIESCVSEDLKEEVKLLEKNEAREDLKDDVELLEKNEAREDLKEDVELLEKNEAREDLKEDVELLERDDMSEDEIILKELQPKVETERCGQEQTKVGDEYTIENAKESEQKVEICDDATERTSEVDYSAEGAEFKTEHFHDAEQTEGDGSTPFKEEEQPIEKPMVTFEHTLLAEEMEDNDCCATKQLNKVTTSTEVAAVVIENLQAHPTEKICGYIIEQFENPEQSTEIEGTAIEQLQQAEQIEEICTKNELDKEEWSQKTPGNIIQYTNEKELTEDTGTYRVKDLCESEQSSERSGVIIETSIEEKAEITDSSTKEYLDEVLQAAERDRGGKTTTGEGNMMHEGRNAERTVETDGCTTRQLEKAEHEEKRVCVVVQENQEAIEEGERVRDEMESLENWEGDSIDTESLRHNRNNEVTYPDNEFHNCHEKHLSQDAHEMLPIGDDSHNSSEDPHRLKGKADESSTFASEEKGLPDGLLPVPLLKDKKDDSRLSFHYFYLSVATAILTVALYAVHYLARTE